MESIGGRSTLEQIMLERNPKVNYCIKVTILAPYRRKCMPMIVYDQSGHLPVVILNRRLKKYMASNPLVVGATYIFNNIQSSHNYLIVTRKTIIKSVPSEESAPKHPAINRIIKEENDKFEDDSVPMDVDGECIAALSEKFDKLQI